MKERFAYIDYAKALAIIMVVTGHIIYFSIFEKDGIKADTLLIEQILKSVQMPLFVFCSGLVVRSVALSVYDTLTDIYKRFRLLIVPFLVVGGFFALITYTTPDYFLSKGMKLGYWYLLTLFELYILHHVYLQISKLWFKRKEAILYDVLIGGGVFFIIRYLYRGVEAEISCWQNMLSILQLVRYYPYFFIATLIKKYDLAEMVFSNKWFHAISLLTSVIILYANTHGIHIPGRTYVLPITLLLTVLYVMRYLERSGNNRIKNILDYIGRHTLDIYIFHYFFIATLNISFLSQLLETNNGFTLSLLLILPWVALVITLSLLLGKIVRSSNILNNIIFFK